VNFNDCSAGSAWIRNNETISATSFDVVPLLGVFVSPRCQNDSTCMPGQPQCLVAIDDNELIRARGRGRFGTVAVSCLAGAECSLSGNADIHTLESGSGATAVDCTWCGVIEDNTITGAIDPNGCGSNCNVSATGLVFSAGANVATVRRNHIAGGCSGSNMGLRYTSGAGTRVENNVIHGFLGQAECGFSAIGWAISAQGGGTYHSNTLIGGNTGNPCNTVLVSSVSTTFRNNIMKSGDCPSPEPISISSPNQPIIVENNNLVGASTTTPPNTQSSGNFTGDPLFMSYPTDLRLGTGSPCINSGTPVGAPAFDIVGTPRDAMPDVGAYERVP
jgi:hypothetical protein